MSINAFIGLSDLCTSIYLISMYLKMEHMWSTSNLPTFLLKGNLFTSIQSDLQINKVQRRRKMSRKTLHLQVSDAESIHPRLKTEKKIKRKWKIVSNRKLLAPYALSQGRCSSLKNCLHLRCKINMKRVDFAPYVQENKPKRTSKSGEM
jgi:hypothetical protein